MKILISHVYSNENKGDAALLSVLLSDIRRAFGTPEVTILTLDKITKSETFEGVPVKNSFMYYARERYHNALLKPFYAFFVATSTLTWAIIYRYTKKDTPLPRHLKDVIKLYRQADLIIPIGGGYIRSKPGFMQTVTLLFTIHPLLFSYIIGKPTINYTQSIGPLGNRFQEFIAKFAIKRLTGIIVREDISFQLLKKWGVTRNVLSSVDGGFLFESKTRKDLRKGLSIGNDQVIVGLTVRTWLSPEGQARYETAIATLCNYIIKKYNAAVIFIPQVTAAHQRDDDRESGQRISKLIANKDNIHVVTEQYDHHTIKAAYSSLDYLVGTRFHSVIFALTSYVPAIAIEYEHKTRGIMADLELENWILDIGNIKADELIKLFDQLVIQRESYIEHLKRVLPPYVGRAQNSIYFLKEVYESNRGR